MAYKKCPRCSLNYIQDHEVLCKICLAEVGKALKNRDEEEEEYDICPGCGDNIIKAGEEMCYQCMLERANEEIDIDKQNKEDWEDFIPEAGEEELVDDEEEDFELDEIQLDEEEDDEEEEEE